MLPKYPCTINSTDLTREDCPTVDTADATALTQRQHELLLQIMQIRNIPALKGLDHGVGIDDLSGA